HVAVEDALDNRIALCLVDPADAKREKMKRRRASVAIEDRKLGPRIFSQRTGIRLEDRATPYERVAVIARELDQTDRRHDVGHVRLVAGLDDVVSPVSLLRLGERILVLAVQSLDAKPAVDLFI